MQWVEKLAANPAVHCQLFLNPSVEPLSPQRWLLSPKVATVRSDFTRAVLLGSLEMEAF